MRISCNGNMFQYFEKFLTKIWWMLQNLRNSKERRKKKVHDIRRTWSEIYSHLFALATLNKHSISKCMKIFSRQFPFKSVIFVVDRSTFICPFSSKPLPLAMSSSCACSVFFSTDLPLNTNVFLFCFKKECAWNDRNLNEFESIL